MDIHRIASWMQEDKPWTSTESQVGCNATCGLRRDSQIIAETELEDPEDIEVDVAPGIADPAEAAMRG